jgi:hypothetical protein
MREATDAASWSTRWASTSSARVRSCSLTARSSRFGLCSGAALAALRLRWAALLGSCAKQYRCDAPTMRSHGLPSCLEPAHRGISDGLYSGNQNS